MPRRIDSHIHMIAPRQVYEALSEVALPRALPASSKLAKAMRGGAAPRAPRRGRRAPPNPLQTMAYTLSAQWHVPPLCRKLASYPYAVYARRHAICVGARPDYANTLVVRCQL